MKTKEFESLTDNIKKLEPAQRLNILSTMYYQKLKALPIHSANPKTK